MSGQQLAPCPFCGGTDIDPDDFWCQTCGTVGPVAHRGGRRQAWNRRALRWVGAHEGEHVYAIDPDPDETSKSLKVIVQKGSAVGKSEQPLKARRAAMIDTPAIWLTWERDEESGGWRGRLGTRTVAMVHDYAKRGEPASYGVSIYLPSADGSVGTLPTRWATVGDAQDGALDAVRRWVGEAFPGGVLVPVSSLRQWADLCEQGKSCIAAFDIRSSMAANVRGGA